MASHDLELLETELGGSPLARAAMDGDERVAAWYEPRPRDASEWQARLAATRARFGDGTWLTALQPAIGASGPAAERLSRVAREGGVLVTTGQQPGLFGGPAYTWLKAISALAMADEIERLTGTPTAPLFWAATDDTDFVEASTTWISTSAGAERLTIGLAGRDGDMLAHMPLGDDVVALRERVRAAALSLADPVPLQLLDSAWVPGTSIGDAYLQLLRGLLEPLGIAVMDAAHPATRAAMDPMSRRALEGAEPIDAALHRRREALQESGFTPQVALVDGLSVVFEDAPAGKARVPLDAAGERARAANEGRLGPNVLLRPVAEQSILPTVAYVAGPGEISYFAQVSAVADALGEPVPLTLPRYSVTIVEPHVRRALDRLELQPDDLLDPHAAERRLARGAVNKEVAAGLEELRQRIADSVQRLASTAAAVSSGGGRRAVPPATVFEGAARQLEHRVERLERRIAAAAASADVATARELAMLRGALTPGGKRQERALNLVPLFARHGTALLDELRDSARIHARRCLGQPAETTGQGRPAASTTA